MHAGTVFDQLTSSYSCLFDGAWKLNSEVALFSQKNKLNIEIMQQQLWIIMQ